MQSSEHSPRPASRWRWRTPLIAAAIGLAYLVAGWLGGDRDFAVGGFVLMVDIAGVMLVAGRFSDTVARGDDGEPSALFGAIGGVSSAALGVLRFRR